MAPPSLFHALWPTTFDLAASSHLSFKLGSCESFHYNERVWTFEKARGGMIFHNETVIL
jgi:hypothetical protein